MRKIFTVFIFLFIATLQSQSQIVKNRTTQGGKKLPMKQKPLQKTVNNSKNNDDSIFTTVEKEAEFAGGLTEWQKYLQRNLNGGIPSDNGARSGQYKVVVKFIVAKDGSISEVIAETNHGYGMEEEVVRVIKKGPKWTPAMQNNKVVKAYRRQPVTFMVL